MIPSYFSQKGLSILVSMPVVQGDDVIGNFSDTVSDYSHTISANGGYTSAKFTLSGNNEFLENWLEYGLGRHVQVFGPQLQTIWEGFVNQVDVNMGNATFTRGPLTNIANRVSAMYTPIIPRCLEPTDPLYDANCTEEDEPITGVTTETLIAEDENSQSRYGIWEKVLNIGEVYDDEAEYIRDLYIEENSYPEGNPSLSISGNEGDMNAKITCNGYIDWINNYAYVDEDDNQSVYCSELIKTILGADPNDIISTMYDKIEENLAIHDSQQLENKMAKTIIDDILTMGGWNDDRWTFGIYKDRKAVYAPIPTEVEYIYYKTGRTQQVEYFYGGILDPWNVVPCKWVAIPTFLTSFGIKINDIRNDPRVFFAEEVNFTAPDQVTINGAKVRKLNQYLAKLGLGGV